MYVTSRFRGNRPLSANCKGAAEGEWNSVISPTTGSVMAPAGLLVDFETFFKIT